MKAGLDLNARAVATNATLARFRNRAFDWKTGATCIHLARLQAKNMGYRVPAVPRFTSPRGALLALRKQGFDTLGALLDARFERIDPARMLIGDLAMLPGEEGADDPLGAVMIFDGLTKLLGWHDADPSRLRPIAHAQADISGAWRL